jgi:hypothetical protein
MFLISRHLRSNIITVHSYDRLTVLNVEYEMQGNDETHYYRFKKPIFKQ